ncbi:hypothetical protein DFJ74DRAFT_649885 [Hyaloraphidium curvatum]|nr:hypothetical protein DFJ74DRAFT_649885 [Hyaloraphidium curvatum]
MTSRVRTAARQTGLQREVLRLYRAFLVCIRDKPDAARAPLHQWVGSQFRANAANVQVKDITAIEFLLRKGRRSLEMLEDKNTEGVSLPATTGWASPVFKTRLGRPPFVRAPKKDPKEAAMNAALAAAKGGQAEKAETSSSVFPAPAFPA